MILFYWTLVVATATAFATMAVGWWAVPLVAVLAAVAAPRRSYPALSLPLGAALGWAALLGRSARADGFGSLIALLGSILPFPAPALLVVTVMYPAIVALGVAMLVSALRPVPQSPSEGGRS